MLGGGLSNIEALYAGLADLIAAYAFSDDIKTKIVKAMHGDFERRARRRVAMAGQGRRIVAHIGNVSLDAARWPDTI